MASMIKCWFSFPFFQRKRLAVELVTVRTKQDKVIGNKKLIELVNGWCNVRSKQN